MTVDGKGAIGVGGWQESMKRAFRRLDELLSWLGLESSEAPWPMIAGPDFPLFVTRELASRMEPGRWDDPLLLQVLPLAKENEMATGFVADPVGDRCAEVVPGLLHKYHRRVLMIATGACAVHCRYCFRRHYPYGESPKTMAQWEPAIDYLRSDSTIDEIILSGGDPLTLSDRRLAELIESFDRIDHLKRLRIHTRLPVMIPSRVCGELLEWLEATRLSAWIVLHINHAHEVDDAVGRAIERLQRTGAMLLNQAVLLRGINDDLRTLDELCRKLLEHRVLPYYLHQLDPVQGAAHFQVPIERGRALIEELARELPGYAVPKYVAEYEGRPYKQSLL